MALDSTVADGPPRSAATLHEKQWKSTPASQFLPNRNVDTSALTFSSKCKLRFAPRCRTSTTTRANKEQGECRVSDASDEWYCSITVNGVLYAHRATCCDPPCSSIGKLEDPRSSAKHSANLSRRILNVLPCCISAQPVASRLGTFSIRAHFESQGASFSVITGGRERQTSEIHALLCLPATRFLFSMLCVPHHPIAVWSFPVWMTRMI